MGEAVGIEFRLLGTVDVVAGDRVVELGSAKQRALLAALVLQLNHVVPVDVLVDDLWGESPPPSAHTTLQSLVSRLRRTLDGSRGIRGRDGGYVLEAEPEHVDAVRFDRLLADGRRALTAGETGRAVDALDAALALWRGAALGNLADRPFARAEAQRLEEARLGAVEDLAEALLSRNRLRDALALLEPYIAEHPLRERAWGWLILALYRLGRQADAMRAYRQVRETVVEELGVEPTPELRALADRILHQAPDLAAHRGGDVIALLFTGLPPDRQITADDLARHDAVLLDGIEAHGGEVVGHATDGFRIAFATVPAAVAVAVMVQRELLDTAFPLRMVVHAGPAERRAGNWFGPTVDRAARLLATAAGGQIVCSDIAAELGRDGLPASTGLLDLGEHRLTDLARRERVYEVTHPGLPREFPPLRSLDTHRHNLPVALTSFVGRERELGEVGTLLATSRLLTVAGPGGSGKTRLALQAAAAALGRFPDGAWFVELAPIRTADLVADEVGAVVGILPGPTGEAPQRRLCAHLQTRRLLLVLDNCEHVVEGAAALAHTVLSRCPDVAVLATSREVLGVPGEVVWTVPPLSLPSEEAACAAELAGSDAVALFCERAWAAKPGFALSDANAAAVARICRRLDGIPLGLELAAGKVRVLGARQVAERLDSRLRLLTGGSRTAVPRHRTLRAAMDWSHALLPADEQVMLRRLSVFRGPFPPAAAEAVVAEPGVDALGLLTRLVDKSMVVLAAEEPEVRYGLLETVREYAGHKLDEAGEADDTRARHRDFFLGVADRWAAGTHYWNWWQWLRRISVDRDDFTAALEWSATRGDDEALLRLVAAHWPYWYWGEALGWRRWLPQAIERCPAPSPARVEALIALASLLMRSGEDPQRCEALFAEAADVAAALPGPQPAAQVDFYRAHVIWSAGDPRKAKGLLRDALAGSTNADFLGWCHWGLGWIALLDEHLDEAAAEFHASLRLGDRVDDESMRAHVWVALALVAALRGHHETAGAMAARAVTSAERTVGAPRVLMMALARAGQIAALAGDGSAAEPVYRLLRLLRDKCVTYWADEALAVAALVLADRRPEEAATLLSSLPESPIAGLRGLVRRCRARLAATLDAEGWRDAEHRGQALPVEEAIARALAALEAAGNVRP